MVSQFTLLQLANHVDLLPYLWKLSKYSINGLHGERADESTFVYNELFLQ